MEPVFGVTNSVNDTLLTMSILLLLNLIYQLGPRCILVLTGVTEKYPI